MSWLAIAKNNQDTEIVKLEKKQIRQVQNIDLYPEDLFEIRYIDEIRQLKASMDKVVFKRGVNMLDDNFSLHELFSFIVFNTNIDNLTEELLNEEPEQKEMTDQEEYYAYQNKNIILNK